MRAETNIAVGQMYFPSVLSTFHVPKHNIVCSSLALERYATWRYCRRDINLSAIAIAPVYALLVMINEIVVAWAAAAPVAPAMAGRATHILASIFSVMHQNCAVYVLARSMCIIYMNMYMSSYAGIADTLHPHANVYIHKMYMQWCTIIASYIHKPNPRRNGNWTFACFSPCGGAPLRWRLCYGHFVHGHHLYYVHIVNLVCT